MAGKTISQIAAYEQELEDKINAEEAFYTNQGKNLVELHTPDGMEAAVDLTSEEKVRNHALYRRISIQTERDGIALMDRAMSQGSPFMRANLMQYASQGITDDRLALESAINGRRQVRKDLLGNLTELEAGKAKLEEARKALTDLRKKKSLGAELKDLLKFGRDVKDRLDADKKPAS